MKYLEKLDGLNGVPKVQRVGMYNAKSYGWKLK